MGQIPKCIDLTLIQKAHPGSNGITGLSGTLPFGIKSNRGTINPASYRVGDILTIPARCFIHVAASDLAVAVDGANG